MALSPKRDSLLKLVLIVANLLALNVLVGPARARVDLTKQSEYTVSEATRSVLRALPDRIEVHGYFSEETHPKLAPLVPKIRDLLEEYRIHSGGKVEVSFVDPRNDEAAEKEAFRRFSVRSAPVPIETKYASGMQSIYFSLVVAFGDRSAKLDLMDLIKVTVRGADLDVRLSNLEYQLTRSIQRVVQEFGSLESRLAELKDPVRVFMYVSEPHRVPEGELRDHIAKKRKQLEEVVEELKKKYKLGFDASVLDPAASPQVAAEAREIYGVQPLRASGPGGGAGFYLDAIVRQGTKAERLAVRDLPERERSMSEIRDAVEGAMRRLLPGVLHRVGVVGNKPDLPPEQLMQYLQAGMQPPGDEFQAIRNALRKGYEVVDVSLADGKPPLDVDVLLVLKPKEWTEKHLLALDQYLMYGGKAIVCVDMTQFPQKAQGLMLEPIAPKVDELLARYGVTVRKELLEDERNGSYPIPVDEDLGGMRMRVEYQLPYPWFIDARGDSIDRENPVVGAVEKVEFYWASPLSIDAERTKGLKVSKLVTSSDRAWTTTDLRKVGIEIESRKLREVIRGGGKWFAVPEKTQRETIAVALEGKLASGMRDRPQAVTPGAGVEPLAESTGPMRLVVIGDSDFASDFAARYGRNWAANVQLVENLIDWALLDEAMLGIRSRGTGDRPLKEMAKDDKVAVEAANYAIPLGLVVAFGLIRALLRRAGTRRVRPQDAAGGAGAAAAGKSKAKEAVRS